MATNRLLFIMVTGIGIPIYDIRFNSGSFHYLMKEGAIMAKTERESKVQEKAIRNFRKYGAYVFKNAQNEYTEVGRPDLTACVPVTIEKLLELYSKDTKIGVFVGIELKRDGKLGDVSLSQEIVGRKIKKASGLWFAIDDADIVEALMIKLGVTKDVVSE